MSWKTPIVVISTVCATIITVAELVLRNPSRPLRFEYGPGPLSMTDFDRLGQRPDWHSMIIPAEEGVKLRAVVRTPQTNNAPWILFFPGNGQHILEGSQELLDVMREKRDWGVLIWAYRGFDGSDGVPAKDAFYQDTVRVYEWLIETFKVSPSHVHAIGFSLGTHFATYLTATLEERGTQLSSLTLLAPFTKIAVAQHSWLGRFAPADLYETEPLLDRIKVRTLVIHGTRDDALPVYMGSRIARHLGTRATYIEVRGETHVGILRAPQTLRAIRECLETAP